MVKTFVISDLHLGHENILKFCERPYSSIEEHDAHIISSWNSVVSSDDNVYMLGDFCLGGVEMAKNYSKQLNGRMCVLSNPWHHDRRWLQPMTDEKNQYDSTYLMKTNETRRGYRKAYMHFVEFVSPIVVLEENVGERYPKVTVLCHYPFEVWDRKHHGSTHLFGHIHSKAGYIEGSMRLDVGVDNLMHMFGSPAPIDINIANEIMRST